MLAPTDLKVGVTGSIAQQYDSQESLKKADSFILIATFGLILVLLLVIFRSPIIAILPLVVIGVVSQVATGLIADANAAFNLHTDSSISQILIALIGARAWWPGHGDRPVEPAHRDDDILVGSGSH